MKVWWCTQFEKVIDQGWATSGAGPRSDLPFPCCQSGLSRVEVTDFGCGWMQLVPADARIVTSSDPELRETIIGLMTSRDWYDWPTDEQYLQECVTEALDGLGKTADV